ncbi:MAG TPA: hypothetical protein VEX39_01430 [Thermoleophilaceae bacterium]|nr:hypothetical protein [Thermoleophilaceae bacterium]
MSKRSHTTIALTTAALAMACGPAAAEAATIKLTHYDVEADVTLVHDHAYHFATGWESQDTDVQLVSDLHTKLGRITFRDGYLMSPVAQGQATADSSGVAKGHYANKVFSGSRSCDTTTGPLPSGQGTIDSDLLAPLTGEAFNLRVTDQVRVDWQCRGDERVSATAPYEYTDNGPALGSGPLDTQFEIPHEAVGYGKIIQNIKGPGGGFCAGAHLSGTTKCGYNWTGEVTLTKTSETVISDVAEPQQAVVPSGSGRGHKEPTAAEIDELLVPLVPAKAAKADAKGSTVSLTASCPTGCAGTAALTVAGAKASGAAKARMPVATMRFKVKAGMPRLVKLRLPKKAARALRRARKGKLAVSLKPKRGRTVKKTLSVKVGKR